MPHISGLLQVVSQLYIEKESIHFANDVLSLVKLCYWNYIWIHLRQAWLQMDESSISKLNQLELDPPIWWYRSYYEVDLGHRKCLMKHCSKLCPKLHLCFVEEYAFQVLWWQLARYWFSMTQFCHAESNISSQ